MSGERGGRMLAPALQANGLRGQNAGALQANGLRGQNARASLQANGLRGQNARAPALQANGLRGAECSRLLPLGYSARRKTLSREARAWQPAQVGWAIESATGRKVGSEPARSYQYQVVEPGPGATLIPTA